MAFWQEIVVFSFGTSSNKAYRRVLDKPLLKTDLYTHQIPEIYNDFAALVGSKFWKKSVSNCKVQIRRNSFLRGYLQAEYAVAYQLATLDRLLGKHGLLPLPEAGLRELYPALSFAAQVLSLYELFPQTHKNALLRRVQTAFKNSEDMRALRHELSAATHFTQRGWVITWPEVTGSGSFDLLVKKGDIELEVECKSFSDDKGRKIHQRDALIFYNQMKDQLSATLKGLSKGLVVVITISSDFSSFRNNKKSLKQLGEAIFVGNSCVLEDGTAVKIQEFNVHSFDDAAPDQSAVRAMFDQVTGTTNRNGVVVFNKKGGALALAVQNVKDDSLLKYAFRKLKDSSAGQLTGSRAGMFFVEFNGVEGAELVSIAEQDNSFSGRPSRLQRYVSRFISSSTRNHVVNVAFIGRGTLLNNPVHNCLSFDGPTYHFNKSESPFWNESFDQIFNENNRSHPCANHGN